MPRRGPALAPYRKDIFLACKTGQRHAEAARVEFKKSLELLRTDYFEVPPRVDYALTQTGESLVPLIESLCEWALDHADVVDAAGPVSSA